MNLPAISAFKRIERNKPMRSYEEEVIDSLIAYSVKENDVETWADAYIQNNGF